MKTKLTITILLVILTIAFVFNKNTKQTSPPVTQGEFINAPPPLQVSISDSFLIGSLDNGQDTNFQYLTDTFGFNLWHRYASVNTIGGKQYPSGWINNGAPGDSLFADKDAYVSQVQDVLYNINNHGMKALMHRPKIEYLCYGQRSDYQCEPAPIDTGMWFYSFNIHNTGITETDSGQGVIHCRASGNGPNHDDSGFVVKRLKANTEQCFRSNDFDAYRWDSQCDWLIKPKIRIDSSFANNPVNYGTSVCRVDVRNQDNNLIKSIEIKVRNFKPDQLTRYDGSYIETFYFGSPWNDTSSQTRTGDWGELWLYYARGNAEDDSNCSKTDIQVYWYGYCDMWIDYVRVDNDIADRLFKGYYEEPGRDWLQWEAQDIANYGNAPLQFYIELFQFNQIPCIEYVNRKLDSLSGRNINVMADQYTFYQYHMPWSERGTLATPQKIKDMYIDRVNAQEVFTGNPYPLTAPFPDGCYGTHYEQYSKIPSTLPVAAGTNVLADSVSPSAYDTWLQGLFDDPCSWYEGGAYNDKCCPNELRGVFMYTMKNGDAVSKLCNIPFIAMLQAHQWVSSFEIDREPTTEELDVMSSLAVSYGARGIIYWGFGSFYNDECAYSYGLMENGHPRYTNVYGQSKLEKFKETVGRLKTWGPALMSFNNSDRESYIYRLERTDCLSETYFKEIVTYKPGSGQPSCVHDDPGESSPPGMVYECYEERYVQTAVFKQDGSNTPYFMIVNRRCSPYYPVGHPLYPNGENGGKRYIRIAFDQNSQSFPVYRNWKILDIANDDWAVEFDKTTGSLIDLGDFEPGEGKLYKIVPVY